MTNEELWIKTLDILKKENQSYMFKTWYQPCSLEDIRDNIAYITLDNQFIKDTIQQQKKHENILKVMNRVSDKKIGKVEILLKVEYEKMLKNPEMFNNLEKKSVNSINSNLKNDDYFTQTVKLNDKYTFDSFITGSGNKLAHAASVAVADSPGETYNPLFLYGDVGLGKTHLMHAIGHAILEKNSNANILYVTSEVFTNELVNSIRDGKNVEFRKRYRNCDVLLIDDIQFIGGKERTQEEFFHTFNTLYEAGKQIIISSDNPPSKIPTLENRLKSRFEQGLLADITPPDYETRLAILRKKSEESEKEVPPEVLEYIADNIKSNIRKLEGALNKIYASAGLYGKEIDLELAKEAIKSYIVQKKIINIDDIKKATAEYYSISVSDLNSKGKNKNIAMPRQISMYLCRTLTGQSLKSIGQSFGKDHSTVVHACNKMEEKILEDKKLNDEIEDIKSILS